MQSPHVYEKRHNGRNGQVNEVDDRTDLPVAYGAIQSGFGNLRDPVVIEQQSSRENFALWLLSSLPRSKRDIRRESTFKASKRGPILRALLQVYVHPMTVKRAIDDDSEGEDVTHSTKKIPRRSTRTRRKSGVSCDFSFSSPISSSSDATPSFETRSERTAARQTRREVSEESSDSEIIFVEAPIVVKKGKTVEKHFSEPITISGKALRPTVAFDTFWRFAAERKGIDDRRRAGLPAPWTKDEILQKYFFCNTFRVLDKGCQFLIKEVIEKGSQDPEEVVFRVILFNTFTKIETWELLARELGPLKWTTYNRMEYRKVLSRAVARGMALYTGAYIKPAPHFGESTNYANHLYLLETLMDSKLASRLLVAPYMADVYDCAAKVMGASTRRTSRIRPQKNLMLEKRYEIERIADDELVDGVRKFLVYWKGYPASDATWECESSLSHDAPGAVEDYLSKPMKR
ncbi:hypothetical protein NLJ89_g4968 [Agrocybe chaxingu]|uniref:Chromo domain-containing protein n=1 Tax=Agrocybe chaxingu TaxID=84603 RepID=A0A9W8K815_9AGAR|nr:hypothetical protein NLJ89_g4968 [Agrocybe chaxingu]